MWLEAKKCIIIVKRMISSHMKNAITPAAKSDLIEIWNYTVDTWEEKQNGPCHGHLGLTSKIHEFYQDLIS
jgi:hypothetical protein